MPNKVRIECAGGCGRFVMLRKSKVGRHKFFVCNSRESGVACTAAVPAPIPGQHRVIEFNAAASFTGVSHVWPDAEQVLAARRAQALYSHGLAHMEIERIKSL